MFFYLHLEYPIPASLFKLCSYTGCHETSVTGLFAGNFEICIRLSGKCLSFTDTCSTTTHLYRNTKPNPSNVVIFILIERDRSYVIRWNNIKRKIDRLSGLSACAWSTSSIKRSSLAASQMRDLSTTFFRLLRDIFARFSHCSSSARYSSRIRYFRFTVRRPTDSPRSVSHGKKDLKMYNCAKNQFACTSENVS